MARLGDVWENQTEDLFVDWLCDEREREESRMNPGFWPECTEGRACCRDGESSRSGQWGSRVRWLCILSLKSACFPLPWFLLTLSSV